MSHLLYTRNISEIGSFTHLPLTQDEQKAGVMFTSAQLAVLQNLRVDVAESKLNLEFTPNDVLGYTQQEAYLKGQLDLISHIFSLRESVIAEAANLNRSDSSINNQSGE